MFMYASIDELVTTGSISRYDEILVENAIRGLRERVRQIETLWCRRPRIQLVSMWSRRGNEVLF